MTHEHKYFRLKQLRITLIVIILLANIYLGFQEPIHTKYFFLLSFITFFPLAYTLIWFRERLDDHMKEQHALSTTMSWKIRLETSTLLTDIISLTTLLLFSILLILQSVIPEIPFKFYFQCLAVIGVLTFMLLFLIRWTPICREQEGDLLILSLFGHFLTLVVYYVLCISVWHHLFISFGITP